MTFQHYAKLPIAKFSLTFFIVKPALCNVLHRVAGEASTPQVTARVSRNSARYMSGVFLMVPRRTFHYELDNLDETTQEYLHIKVTKVAPSLPPRVGRIVDSLMGIEMLKDPLYRADRQASIDGNVLFIENRG
jgi:hypothetical protein